MAENFGNNYVTTLAADISSSDTTLTVGSAAGAPSPNFRIIIDQELMLVTDVSGTTFTVTRGIEGTTAAAHLTGTAVAHVLTAGGLATAIDGPDEPPMAASVYDDEMDATPNSNWTTLESPTLSRTDMPGKDKITTPATTVLVGREQAIPGSFPFTVTLKVSLMNGYRDYHRMGGLVFLPSGYTSASQRIYFGVVNVTEPILNRIRYSNNSTYGDEQQYQRIGRSGGPVYLRATFTSATAITWLWSFDGVTYETLGTYTSPFSVARMGYGLAGEVSGGSGQAIIAYFDWFRVS